MEKLYKLEVCGSDTDKGYQKPSGMSERGGCALDCLSTPLLSGEVVKACYHDRYRILFLILVPKHHVLGTNLLQSSVQKYKWNLLYLTNLFWLGDRE